MDRPVALSLVAIALLAPPAAAEDIGRFGIVAAPIDAALQAGGGPQFTWLNTQNTPVTPQQAFSGLELADDGYANASAGATILLTYAAGVLSNGPGPDLVLLDAGADITDIYLVSAANNNFSQSAVLAASEDTGVERAYYAGGAGPLPFRIMAREFDLTQLGVAPGAAVTQLRIFTEGPACDLLGVGVLRPAMAGDMNCDGNVNNFDVDPFVLAVIHPQQYRASYPGCPKLNGDINHDGRFDNFDIDPFIACRINNPPPGQPCP